MLLGEVRGMDERESEGLVALREGVNRGAPAEALLVSLSIPIQNFFKLTFLSVPSYLLHK